MKRCCYGTETDRHQAYFDYDVTQIMQPPICLAASASASWTDSFPVPLKEGRANSPYNNLHRRETQILSDLRPWRSCLWKHESRKPTLKPPPSVCLRIEAARTKFEACQHSSFTFAALGDLTCKARTAAYPVIPMSMYIKAWHLSLVF